MGKPLADPVMLRDWWCWRTAGDFNAFSLTCTAAPSFLSPLILLHGFLFTGGVISCWCCDGEECMMLKNALRSLMFFSDLHSLSFLLLSLSFASWFPLYTWNHLLLILWCWGMHDALHYLCLTCTDAHINITWKHKTSTKGQPTYTQASTRKTNKHPGYQQFS